MMKAPLCKCSKCDGAGIAPLDREPLQTYLRLAKAKKPLRSEQLSEKGVTPGAICNRLVRMEALGLVERVGKDGKNILWQIKK